MERMSVSEYKDMMSDPKQKTKNVRNRIKGTVNRRNGKLFEGIIEAACEQYFIKDIAHIEKTPEPMRPITGQSKDGSFKAVFEKKAQADFKGTLKGGRSVHFEAKHTDADRIEYSAVSDKQEENLDKTMQMDGVCFVLVSFGFQSFYKVPWGVWKNMKGIFGRKYLKPEDLEQYKVEYMGYLKFLG